TLRVTVTVGSDFRDMFDVRGYTARATHGTIEPPVIDGERVELRYVGLDGLRRSTNLRFDPAPNEVTPLNLEVAERIQARLRPGISGHGDMRTEYAVIPPAAAVHFDIQLPPKQHRSITLQVVPYIETVGSPGKNG